MIKGSQPDYVRTRRIWMGIKLSAIGLAWILFLIYKIPAWNLASLFFLTVAFRLDKDRLRHSEQNEALTQLAAEYAAKVGVQKPDWIEEAPFSRIYRNTNADVFFISASTHPSVESQETRFALARAVTEGVGPKGVRMLLYIAPMLCFVFGLTYVLLLWKVGWYDSVISLFVSVVGLWVFLYINSGATAKQDLLALALFGDTELGIQYLEKSYRPKNWWLGRVLWNRRIGIVRRYVEGKS